MQWCDIYSIILLKHSTNDVKHGSFICLKSITSSSDHLFNINIEKPLKTFILPLHSSVSFTHAHISSLSVFGRGWTDSSVQWMLEELDFCICSFFTGSKTPLLWFIFSQSNCQASESEFWLSTVSDSSIQFVELIYPVHEKNNRFKRWFVRKPDIWPFVCVSQDYR